MKGINNQHEMDQLKPLLEKYENFLAIKEPFSNQRMPLVYTERHETAKAK